MKAETEDERKARWARDAQPASTETREQMIARWERMGALDPDCPGCREWYISARMPSEVFAPGHRASQRCQSGKHPHCTCDTCF